jgi:flagellar biosynthesis protein FlhF
MQGETLREWLWHAWSARQGMDSTLDAEQSVLLRQQVVGLIGATGVGKTTTLAKISSILRHSKRQNNVIVTLDTQRFGANEQIRRLTKLLGVALHEIVTPEDISKSMETWGHFDWVGIDTPGGMTPGSQAGRLFGSILARMTGAETLMLLPAGLSQEDGQAQLRRGEAFGARGIIFSKLDETTRPGSMINLTMDGKWKIDSVTTGQRVPDDWTSASGRLLWNQVLAPREPGGVGRMLA